MVFCHPLTKLLWLALMGFWLWPATVCAAADPALPAGLANDASSPSDNPPDLPMGLGKTEQISDPELPAGLDEKKSVSRQKQETRTKPAWHLPAGLSGYLEGRGGLRMRNDPVHDDIALLEGRMQLGYAKYLPEVLPQGSLRITTDLVYDAEAVNRQDIDLQTGEGFLDLREFWVSLTPLEFLDVKAGRQILTWGTGNLVFLNDLFPKDYQSFFLGRDVDYLKAPSDAAKASIYSQAVNIDIVYTPQFDADRFVDGSRLSFYDPALGAFRGEDEPLAIERPDRWFEDDEIAIRLYRNLGTYELALYGYHGFWKSPSGSDPETGLRIFPALAAYGASLRGPAGPGIGNLEFAWYDSKDDATGEDPFVNNSEIRFLAGYEQEVATDLTLGIQYYLEHMLDHEDYLAGLPAGFPARREDRHWLTLDLTRQLMAQKQLVLSLFTFYDLSADAWYLRPRATYDVTDQWQVQVGANIFLGDRETFFGRFRYNDNGFIALRLSF